MFPIALVTSRKAVLFWIVLAAVCTTLISPPMQVRSAGVIGSGTPASCDESALTTALTGGGEITFNCGGAATINLTSYKTISDDTVIDGGGVITLTATNTYFFQVFSAQSLTLKNITLSGGASNVTGGIENFGTLTIENSELKGNRTTNQGGAILNHGVLNLINSTLSGNQAAKDGGAVFNNSGSVVITGSEFIENKVTGSDPGTGGGLAVSGGTLSVENSLFQSNSSLHGGAIQLAAGSTGVISATQIISNTAGYGGGIENFETLTITYSSLVSNRAQFDGGGIWNASGSLNLRGVTLASNEAGITGGGLTSSGNSAILEDVTFSGNVSSHQGGGIYSQGAIRLTNVTLNGNRAVDSGGGGMFHQGNGAAILTFVTISDNQAQFGAGVYKEGSQPGTLSLQNVLLANNATGNCDGVIESLGNNLSTDTNCAALIEAGDQQSATLLLAALADNGGHTQTRLHEFGSAAVDHGKCLATVFTDQRGIARPLGPACDVGAVEFTPQEPTPDDPFHIYLPWTQK